MFRHLVFAVLTFGAVTTLRADLSPATAPTDRDSIVAEIKTDQEAIRSISEELKADEKEANDAETLAAHPPASVGADKKIAYIDSEKNQAQSAHDSAKEARERLDEAKKSLDDAVNRLKAIDHK